MATGGEDANFDDTAIVLGETVSLRLISNVRMAQHTTEDAPIALAFVIPIQNKQLVAEHCLRSIAAAVDADRASSLVIVDHASRDGTLAIAQRIVAGRHQVLTVSDGRVGKVRNVGAKACEGDWLVFIDGDCAVPLDVAERLRTVIRRTEASAVGCEVVLPPHPNWIEKAWDDVTRGTGEGEVLWVNSGCFAVRRDLFVAVQGFDESRTSGEDVDICVRLRALGAKIWQHDALAVEHHGNPRSLEGFYKRLRWHGEGAVDINGTVQVSGTLVFLLAHLVLLALTIGALIACLRQVGSLPWAIVFLVLPWLVPGLLFFRAITRRRKLINPVTSLLLLQLASLARLHGLVRGLSRANAQKRLRV